MLTGEGGAVYVQGGPAVMGGCTFIGNSVESFTGNVMGGAVDLQSGANITDSVFADNVAYGYSQSALYW